MKFLPKNLRGFTLIELLVVIGVLTILLAIVLIAINPARQFAQANNTQRRSDVNAILNAVHQYAADNGGNLPTGIDATARTICVTGAGPACAVSAVDLCSSTNAEIVSTYLADLPLDPSDGTTDATGVETCADMVPATDTYNTGYTIQELGSSGRIVVIAPSAELSETIQVTR